MWKPVGTVIAALAIVLPAPAAAQGTRPLAEAIAASVMTFANESMPTVLCIRLLGSDGQAMAVPQELPGLVENKVGFARTGSSAPKILGGCGGGFGSDGGGSGSGIVLTVSVRHDEDQKPEAWITLPGQGLGTALTCSLPEDVRVTTQIQSTCSPRAR